MISMLIYSQGYPETLCKTIDSYLPHVDEVIIGDVMIFEDDRQKVVDYYEGNEKVKIKLRPFNFLFEHGFSYGFNFLAEHHAQFDKVLLMGVGNVLESEFKKPDESFNMWAYERNDGQICHTMYNRHQLTLQFCIHEEVTGPIKWLHKPLFKFGDIPKDPNRLVIMNDVKEIVYFEQYRKLLDGEDTSNPGWEHFARKNSKAIRDTLVQQDKRRQAFIDGDIVAYRKLTKKFIPNNIPLKYS